LASVSTVNSSFLFATCFVFATTAWRLRHMHASSSLFQAGL
jgi:hypothetical protein